MSPLAWFDFRLSQITLRPATCEIRDAAAQFVEESGGQAHAMQYRGARWGLFPAPRARKRGIVWG